MALAYTSLESALGGMANLTLTQLSITSAELTEAIEFTNLNDDNAANDDLHLLAAEIWVMERVQFNALKYGVNQVFSRNGQTISPGDGLTEFQNMVDGIIKMLNYQYDSLYRRLRKAGKAGVSTIDFVRISLG